MRENYELGSNDTLSVEYKSIKGTLVHLVFREIKYCWGISFSLILSDQLLVTNGNEMMNSSTLVRLDCNFNGVFPNNFQCLEHFMWDCSQVNVTEHLWWCQYWFGLWFGSVRQQAITWATVDPDLCRHMAWLGQDELTKIITQCFEYVFSDLPLID